MKELRQSVVKELHIDNDDFTGISREAVWATIIETGNDWKIITLFSTL